MEHVSFNVADANGVRELSITFKKPDDYVLTFVQKQKEKKKME